VTAGIAVSADGNRLALHRLDEDGRPFLTVFQIPPAEARPTIRERLGADGAPPPAVEEIASWEAPLPWESVLPWVAGLGDIGNREVTGDPVGRIGTSVQLGLRAPRGPQDVGDR
jgi:hypothetical protein